MLFRSCAAEGIPAEACVPRHPSQFYEFLMGLLTFGVVMAVQRANIRRAGSGLIAGVFLTCYFSCRFIVEFFKEFQVEQLRTGGPLGSIEQSLGMHFRMGQWLSVLPILLGLFCIVRALRQIGEVQRTVARRFPSVVWIDASSLFDDAQGQYASRIVDEQGKTITVRAGDGVHFSPEGGDYLARAVYAEIDRLWHLDDQADPTQPQRVVETKGSSYVEGTRRSTTSTSWSGSSTTSTTSGSGSTSTSSTTTTTAPAPTTTTTTAAVTQGGGRGGPTGPPG